MPTNLGLQVANFTRLNGYFYHFDYLTDVLYKKVDSGSNAFSYPTNTDVTNEVKCLQTDGTYFYTLENINSGNGNLLFKKWKIQEYTLQLQRTYSLAGSANQKYDCNSFSIESFNRSFSTTVSSGISTITLNDNSRAAIGDILNLGPSTFTGEEGKSESVTILSILSGNQVQLTTPLQHSYSSGNTITFAKRCWFFNKFRPNDSDNTNGSGQLYSFDLNPIVTTVVARKAGNEFRNILASQFIKDLDYPSGARDFLAYMVQTNLLFLETDDTSPNFLSVMQSAAQNNQETTSTVIPVYDLAYEARTLFRLQHKATYRNGDTYTTEDWGVNYNYQVATLQRLPQSISLTATPPIIDAVGSGSSSHITGYVTDQFGTAIVGRTVNFTDDDTVGSPAGFMKSTQVTTSGGGECDNDYYAGTIAKTVTISVYT